MVALLDAREVQECCGDIFGEGGLAEGFFEAVLVEALVVELDVERGMVLVEIGVDEEFGR